MSGTSFPLSRAAHAYIAFCLLAHLFVTETGLAQSQQNPAYMGVGSCSSSNCHGSVSPRNAGNVLQNEYVTWEKHDPHSKAWINLTNEDSKKIASHLGIAAAEKEPLCLRCHATYLESGAREGSNYHLEDGVGCESCHGAAENYLGPHTAKDATREHNVETGMLDVVNPDKRVKLCATCHFGGQDKNVNHRLIGAGHPRLTFELDTFSMIQPKHWVIDEDYIKRKGDYVSARAWLVGQTYLADLTLKRLKSDKLSKHGIFPELTIFYCFTCHHSLTEDQWKSREYGGRPGELQLNVSSLVIVREALKVMSPKLADKVETSLQSLHSSYAAGSLKDVELLEAYISEARKTVESASYEAGSLRKLMKALANFGELSSSPQYEVAEQVAMGLSSILASISEADTLYKSEIEAIYAALSNSEAFEPSAFSAACGSLNKRLS